jgi:hypothetical protein
MDARVALSGGGGVVIEAVVVGPVPMDDVHPGASITAARTRIRDRR